MGPNDREGPPETNRRLREGSQRPALDPGHSEARTELSEASSLETGLLQEGHHHEGRADRVVFSFLPASASLTEGRDTTLTLAPVHP